MKHLLVLLLFFAGPGWAVDNPDAPNHVGNFEARVKAVEAQALDNATSTRDYQNGLQVLENALDKELNGAYKQLMSKLADTGRKALRQSQRKWLKYRDAEFSFMAANFATAKFGSSAAISIGGYRTNLIKARVKALLGYLGKY